MAITINEFIDFNELEEYEQAVTAFVANEIDPNRFMAMRLQQGVYGQRQEGLNMIRIKIPGGVVSGNQLDCIADVLSEFSLEAFVNITTRQDIQIHSVPLAKTPKALFKLANAGLTTREACGNTLRNITACPLAGVCPKEYVDVQPVVNKIAEHFLRHPLTQHLPRKFKISVSGCEIDCANGLIHDLAIVATHNNAQPGFRVFAGGGLGHKPHSAIELENFITAAELLTTIEAVLRLHNRYSDRSRRARSRLKFLVDRFGATDFIKQYQKELEKSRAANSPHQSLVNLPWHIAANPNARINGNIRTPVKQKQAGLVTLPVSLHLGDVDARQLKGIAKSLRYHGLQYIKTTADQNFLVINVAENDSNAIYENLAKFQLRAPVTGDNIVSCPGTWTCRLGITASRSVSDLVNGSGQDISIRISGCHNCCGQSPIGDIGLHGEAKRVLGTLIPYYRTHFGGDGKNSGQIAITGPDIPAVSVGDAIQDIQNQFTQLRNGQESFSKWAQRQGKEYFFQRLAKFTEVAKSRLDYFSRDHGEYTTFKVVPLGGGECGGAGNERVSAKFAEAAHERRYRQTFVNANEQQQALECVEAICRLIGQALVASHVKPRTELSSDLTQLKQQLRQICAVRDDLVETFSVFTDELSRLKKSLCVKSLNKLISAQDLWTTLAAEFCQQQQPELALQSFIPELSQLTKKQEATA